ncbi:hypothetical protein GTV15_20915 [Streptomyces sp. SID7803]|nr:hypothetical protein [Streptomyces sp. SID7803]
MGGVQQAETLWLKRSPDRRHGSSNSDKPKNARTFLDTIHPLAVLSRHAISPAIDASR